jgi:hypothetical protein
MTPEPRPLAHWLAQAAQELNAEVAPPLAPVATLTTPLPATPARRRVWVWGGAGAGLGLALAGLVFFMLAPEDLRQHNPSANFQPVASAEHWQRLREEGGAAWLVSAELPSHRLLEFGLPFDPSRAAQPVRAELLMRASGEVLALRLID